MTMDYYLLALEKYAVFKGRSSRAEYWYFVLFHIIIGLVLAVIDNALGTYLPGSEYGLLSGVYSLAVLVPSLAVSVRRLHDTGKSGWVLLIVLIPLIGLLWLIVLMMMDSEPGENGYGPNPKGIEAA